MNKIDTAASKGFRIASRLIGYIGLGLCIALFICGYALPNGFWIKGATRYRLEFLGEWGLLNEPRNENKLMTLAIVAGAILVIAILFRIISACCKTTVEEAVEAECAKAVDEVAGSTEKTGKKLGKHAAKVRDYIGGKAKEMIPEDKMPYVEKAGDFLKKYSAVILASAATLTAVVVITNAKEESHRRAERRRFLRSLM
ncbi:MAG TPA: hypothetical protein DDW30_08440 [Clostridiales bacterium]|nr:hypothetical protein [Clostridiales bacterium]